MKEGGYRDALEHKERTQADKRLTRYKQYSKMKGTYLNANTATKACQILCGKTDAYKTVAADAGASRWIGKGKKARLQRADKQLYVEWEPSVAQACMGTRGVYQDRVPGGQQN